MNVALGMSSVVGPSRGPSAARRAQRSSASPRICCRAASRLRRTFWFACSRSAAVHVATQASSAMSFPSASTFAAMARASSSSLTRVTGQTLPRAASGGPGCRRHRPGARDAHRHQPATAHAAHPRARSIVRRRSSCRSKITLVGDRFFETRASSVLLPRRASCRHRLRRPPASRALPSTAMALTPDEILAHVRALQARGQSPQGPSCRAPHRGCHNRHP